MNFRTQLCSLLLAGLMIFSLTACSGKDANELPLPSDDSTESPSGSADSTSDSLLPDDFVVDTSAEDVCLATLGVPGNFELFTVNGIPVTASSFLYHLSRTISYMEDSMASYYGITLDWNSDPMLAEYAKEDAFTAAVQYSLITSKAKELGFEMTDAQRTELEASEALTIEYMGGEEALRDELRKLGFDYDTFHSVNAASYYYLQLQAGLFADRPSAEEMNTYIEENDILRAKHILLMTVDSTTREALDEETIAQKKATAEDILSQLQASTDLEADFDALMNQYSEDPGLAYYPDGYTFTAGEMVAEFEDATRQLEYGQISGIVESASTGYHIILRLDPDTEDTRADCLNSLISDQLSAWTEDAEIVLTEEYEALDVLLFYEKYVAYQDAFIAESSDESSAD